MKSKLWRQLLSLFVVLTMLLPGPVMAATHSFEAVAYTMPEGASEPEDDLSPPADDLNREEPEDTLSANEGDGGSTDTVLSDLTAGDGQLSAEQLLGSLSLLEAASSTTVVDNIEDYWHISQVQSTQAQHDQGIWLGEGWEGVAARFVLADSAGNPVGFGDLQVTGSTFGELYTDLFTPAGLAPGDYLLQAVAATGDVHPTWSRTLTVTDSRMVVYRNFSGLNGGNLLAGDSELLVQVTAFGVADPDELELSLEHPDQGTPVFLQAEGALLGVNAQGASELIYRLRAVDGYYAEQGVNYNLQIATVDQQPLLTPAYQVWVNGIGERIYRVEVLDSAVARLSVGVENFPQGEFEAELQVADEFYNWSLVAETTAAYDGGGSLVLQFDRQGEPICLAGTYQLLLRQGEFELSSDQFNVSNRLDSLPERYQQTVLTDITWAELESGQTVLVSGHIANLGSGPVQLELVQVDHLGQIERVPGWQPVSLSAVVTYDPLAYRFINYYQLHGSFTVPADLEPTADYRWLVSCQNLSGEERALLSQFSLGSGAVTPSIGEILVRGAPALSGGHGGGGHQMPQRAYLIGLDTDQLEVELEWPRGIFDLDQLTLTLQNAGGTTVGSLRPGSANDQIDAIHCQLDIPTPLAAGSYQLIAGYGEQRLAAATIRVIEEAVLSEEAVYASKDQRFFASGTDFSLKFDGALNIDPVALAVRLHPVDGGAPIDTVAATAKQGLSLQITSQASEVLHGVYAVELMHGEEPLQMLDYFGQPVDVLPQVICFLPSARVDQAVAADDGYCLQGSGFASGTAYTAVLHRPGQPLTRTAAAIPLTRQSSTELFLAASDLPADWKGTSSVLVLADQRPLPVTRNLMVILQASEIPVIAPVVSINDGATFTFDPEVEVWVSPGTYSEMRVALSPAGLATESYQPVTATFSYHLGDSFGPKELHLQFRDASGRETLLTRDIEYLSQEMPQPAGYGLSAEVVCAGMPLTIWVKSSLPVQAQAKLVDGEGNVIGQEITLARTGLEYGVSTYSRTLSIESGQHQAVQAVELTLLETRTGRTWTEELPLQFESRIFISQARTEIQRVYYYQSYARRQSPIKYSVTGSPGLAQAVAVLSYDTPEADGLTSSIPLVETAPGTGIYQGEQAVPAGATMLKQVEYRLSSDLQNENWTEMYYLPVTASLQFAGLPAGGDYDGLSLTLYKTTGWANYQQEISGHDPVQFKDIPAGEYQYSLSDDRREYAGGETQLVAGQAAEVSLASVPLPAKLCVDVDQSDVSGRVVYQVGDDQSGWSESLPIGETLSGLVVGDAVTYQVQINYPAVLSYFKPGQVGPIVIESTDQTIIQELVPIKRVSIAGRVLDELYATAANPKQVPVPGATIYLQQVLDNAGTLVYNNQSVTAGADGRFSLSVFAEVGGTLQVSKSGYTTLERELTAAELQSGQLEDLLLRYLNTGYLSFELAVAPASPSAGEPGFEPEFLPSAAASAYITRVERADGSSVMGSYNHANRTFHFYSGHGLSAGDVLTVQVWAGDGLKLQEQEIAVLLDAHVYAVVAAQATAPGIIQGTATNQQGYPVYFLLFDQASGNRIQIYSGSAFSTRDLRLAPGSYTLIYISGDDLDRTQRLTRLQQLEELGLVAGEHYAKRQLSLTQGLVVDLGNVEVPTVTDDELGYLATQGTGVAVKAMPLTEVGRTSGTVTLRYAMPERLRQLGYTVTAVEVSMPSSTGRIVNREFYLNGTKGSTYYDSYLSATVASEYSGSGVLQFDLVLDLLSQVELTATAMVHGADHWMTETIYQGAIDLPLLTLSVPEEVPPSATGQIKATGVGYAGELVQIWDGGSLVGQAIADQKGRWEAVVNLTEPQVSRPHQLMATMQVGGQELSAIAHILIVPRSAIRVDEVRVWQPYLFQMDLGFTDGFNTRPMTINPSSDVFARFKLVNASADDIAYAGLVNDFRGQTTLFPATYMESGVHAGFWLVNGVKLRQPGVLSVAFSLKVQEDPLQEARAVAQLTNTQVIDVSELPDLPELDVNTLPGFMQAEIRNADDPFTLVVTDDSVDAPYLRGDEGGDGDISATLDLGNGRRLALVGSSQAHSGSIPDGYIRIDTEQGAYWTKSPEVTEGPDSITVRYRAYFSQQLWQAISSGQQPQGRMMAMSGTQDGVQALEYTSTATGVGADLYELKKGANSLGRLGKGLNVLGGISLAASALLGEMGLDPAAMRAAADLIVEDELQAERQLIIGFINEYQAATKKSHYINTFIGGVGYVASFAGPLGKGLSYVATVGGTAYSSAIGSEYDSWGNSIVSMIRSALAKQERLLAKKKKLNEPNWKIDPSGYVFEATEAERITGVTATVLMRDGAVFRVWSEAEEWDEINPQLTDDQGKYGWDVPVGEWKVRFESADYQTYETKSMEVPPLHDQVNIGLLAKAAPRVTEVGLYPDALMVSFDRYMLPESLTGNVLISTDDGRPIAVREILPVDAVENTGYTGAGDYSDLVINAEQFSRQFKIIPDTPTGGFVQYQDDGETPATYKLRLLAGIVSYAQVPLAAAYESEPLPVSEREAIAITVRANIQSKVYGASDPDLSYEVISGDFDPDDQLSGELSRQPGESVGSYQITQGSLSGGEKYAITFQGEVLTITRRPITVASDAKQKYVGSADPSLTWRVTSGSLVGADALSGELSRQPGEGVGAYQISQGTLAASSNYLLTYVPANLTIVARPTTPPDDPGSGEDGDTSAEPELPQPGDTVLLPLVAAEQTDAAGSLVGYSYQTPATLTEEIGAAVAQGAVRFDLHLGADGQNDATVPRSLTIASEVLQAAAAGTGFTLTVSSPAGSISLPPALVTALAAAGQPLSLVIHRTEATSKLPTGANAVDLPLAVETALRGRTEVGMPLQLALPQDPVERLALLHSLTVFSVHSDGGQELIYDLQLDIDETVSPAVLRSVSFQVDRFSSFTLVKFATDPLHTTVGVPGYTIAGESKDLPACFYLEGDTMMPLRMLQDYGVILGWEPVSKTVTVAYRGRTVTLVVGSTIATVDGAEQSIVGASGRLLSPVISGGRAMLPLRFVSEVLGFQVHWEPSHLITIRP